MPERVDQTFRHMINALTCATLYSQTCLEETDRALQEAQECVARLEAASALSEQIDSAHTPVRNLGF